MWGLGFRPEPGLLHSILFFAAKPRPRARG
jgi:hypothetical protein